MRLEGPKQPAHSLRILQGRQSFPVVARQILLKETASQAVMNIFVSVKSVCDCATNCHQDVKKHTSRPTLSRAMWKRLKVSNQQ